MSCCYHFVANICVARSGQLIERWKQCQSLLRGACGVTEGPEQTAKSAGRGGRQARWGSKKSLTNPKSGNQLPKYLLRFSRLQRQKSHSKHKLLSHVGNNSTYMLLSQRAFVSSRKPYCCRTQLPAVEWADGMLTSEKCCPWKVTINLPKGWVWLVSACVP